VIVVAGPGRKRFGQVNVFGFSDSFASTQNPYTGQGQGLGGASFFGDWGDMQTANGNCYGTTISVNDYDDSLVVWNTASADHYVEAVIHRSSAGYNAGNTHEVQLIVRANGSNGDLELWEILCEHQSTSLQLVHWNGPLNDVTVDSFTTGGSIGATPQDGDVFRAEMSGNTLTVKWNGSTVATKSTSLYAGNSMAGIMCFARTGATLANFGFKSVEVGEL
jgi:hypothetical protein